MMIIRRCFACSSFVSQAMRTRVPFYEVESDSTEAVYSEAVKEMPELANLCDVSKSVCQFREISYDDGELSQSNLDAPPTRENPHPFDSKSLPPTHARSIADYVNHIFVLQKLLNMGVDLLEVEKTTKLGRLFLRLDWDNDVKRKLQWLVKYIGVETNDIGNYLTRNPFFLVQKLEDMQERVDYLLKKGFSIGTVRKIVIASRYWLNMDLKATDARLGFLQRQFQLKGPEIRQLIAKEPRVIMFGLGPIQRLVIALNVELGFSKDELKKMIIEDPRIFLCEAEHIQITYHYLTRVMKISNRRIAECPMILRCSVAALQKRHEFLYRLRKANYDDELPDSISLKMLLHRSDKFFAEQVAGSSLHEYDRYLKLL